jgi:CheY-like chemotaxis protein
MNNSAAPTGPSSPQGALPHGASPAVGRCLIVDDDAGIRRLIAYNLGKLGVKSAECATVSAVEPALSEHDPDLIFLDLGLEDGDEYSVLSLLAARGFSGRVQIVSGRAAGVLDEICDWGRARGLTMLPPLPKPFRSSAIKALVDAGA